MHSRRMSVTMSIYFELEGRGVFLWGDKIWDSLVMRPNFGVTEFDICD